MLVATARPWIREPRSRQVGRTIVVFQVAEPAPQAQANVVVVVEEPAQLRCDPGDLWL
jgi:hypothetical protein